MAKLKGTYVDALPALVNPATGRVHTSFNQTVAATGRLSSSDPNLQNIPARTEQGKQIRQAFLPPDGWLILTADYSQVELRLLAHLSGDEVMRQSFAEDRDSHSTSVAASIFKVPEDEGHQRPAAAHGQDSELRRLIYAEHELHLGLGRPPTGMGKAEAQRFIDDYFARFPKVLAYPGQILLRMATTNAGTWRRLISEAADEQRNSELSDWDVKSTYRNRSQAAREAINMEIQGSAADLMKLAMLHVHRRLASEQRQAKMLLSVHDELGLPEVPPGGCCRARGGTGPRGRCPAAADARRAAESGRGRREPELAGCPGRPAKSCP